MPHSELTTSHHLVQRPRYRSRDGLWRTGYSDAFAACGETVTWDVAGLQSLSSFFYSCADHTLVREVTRQPWISRIDAAGDVALEDIPNHGLQWTDSQRIATELRSRLDGELLSVCRNRKRIYLLLSGGLDSRVVAGALADAYRRGDLAAKPIGVTWGFDDSRDVVYAREVARLLDFEWIHIPSRPEDLLDNVEAIAQHLGALVPPIDIHRILWFRDVEPDAIVLAGSYGDSVGRGEFSRRTVLELQRHDVRDRFQLLKSEYAVAGKQQLDLDFAALRRRKPGQHEYVHCEHEQQCHYMRGLFGIGLSLIGRYCDLYQMFTAPAVYGFMWSLHPALRTDEPYARLLCLYDERLAKVPWARTNRGVFGGTIGAQAGLKAAYHDYAAWVREPLYERLRDLVDASWFAQLGVFDAKAIERIHSKLRSTSSPGQQIQVARMFLWLATVRRFVDLACDRAVRIVPPEVDVRGVSDEVLAPGKPGLMRRWLRANPALWRWVKKQRANRLRRRAVRQFPPTTFSPEKTQVLPPE